MPRSSDVLPTSSGPGSLQASTPVPSLLGEAGQLPPKGSPSRAISPRLSSKNGSLAFCLSAYPQISVSNTAR